MIRLKAVSKTFKNGRANEYPALRSIDAVIPSRQVTVVRGPSGSGKTTLLSLIAGISRPTTGRIWIGDTEITQLPGNFLSRLRRRTFGFVFQDFHLIAGFTVLENVMLPAYPSAQDYSQIRKAALALLQGLHMEGKAQEAIGNLSSGEQQRVAVARALINDPEVVLADEPTAHLDSQLAHEFLQIVGILRERGKTILMASHDPRVWSAEVTENVIALRDGWISGTEGM